MKRIALVMALVVMAAGACKKAQQSNATPPADAGKMADSMKMAPADTTHMMMGDTAKAHMAPAPAHAPAPAPAPAHKAPAHKP
ncbi:MAG TPA: hypothetical protein VGU74_16460 [Gemmatimonadales bacterium]|nr:hypothetical protein [Gemmatimonadales bacterium]